jgi:hypothetical protein
MNIFVDGSNFFHTGWLACYLGLPRDHPAANALKPGDLAAFLDGWDMCYETPEDGRPCRADAFRAMRRVGQAVVTWVDDEGNDLPEDVQGGPS